MAKQKTQEELDQEWQAQNHARLVDELLSGTNSLSTREVAAANEIRALREQLDGKNSNSSSRSGKRGDKDADESAD